MVVLGLGMLVALVVAGTVVYTVAVPHLREGDPLLTPHGERLARHARGRARLAQRRTRVRVRRLVTRAPTPREGTEHERVRAQERITR